MTSSRQLTESRSGSSRSCRSASATRPLAPSATSSTCSGASRRTRRLRVVQAIDVRYRPRPRRCPPSASRARRQPRSRSAARSSLPAGTHRTGRLRTSCGSTRNTSRSRQRDRCRPPWPTRRSRRRPTASYLIGGEAAGAMSAGVVIVSQTAAPAAVVAAAAQRPFAGKMLIADRGDNRLIVVDANKQRSVDLSGARPAGPSGWLLLPRRRILRRPRALDPVERRGQQHDRADRVSVGLVAVELRASEGRGFGARIPRTNPTTRSCFATGRSPSPTRRTAASCSSAPTPDPCLTDRYHGQLHA